MSFENKAKCIQCVKADCTNCVMHSITDTRIAPFEDVSRKMQKLFSYFLHLAPDITSYLSKTIPVQKHDEIFARMFDGRHFKYQHFCASNKNIGKEFAKAHLNGEDLCYKCKRYVCKKRRPEFKESDLDCFLRHIRNAIAHGRVSYVHAGNRIHVVFEDENTTRNLSARIICTKADLEHWKKVLSCPKNYT